MKKLSYIAVLAVFPAISAWAEPELYGRANVSFELADETAFDGTVLRSNSSRLGFKGSEQIADRYEVVYQLEYGVSFDDGGTFSQRNIFVGVQSDWGRVIAGHFDTPLKSAQGKVDLFSDLRGDIANNFTANDIRASNNVMYTTPASLGAIQANVAYISSEDEASSDGVSASVSYSANGLYAAVAADQNVVDDTDTLRTVGTYNLDAWQFGAMVEVSDTPARGTAEGVLLSGQYQLNETWVLKSQIGQSDIIAEGTDTLSFGADYRLTRTAKVFGFLTYAESDELVGIGEPAIDGTYLGVGFETRF